MTLMLRERFGPKGPAPRRLLNEDFEFSAERYPSIQKLAIKRDELDMLEKPLAVTRRYVLSQGFVGYQLEFALCLTGPEAAVDLLFERASAFQREPRTAAVINLPEAERIGEVGVAWRWSEHEAEGVLGFVRHNVLVFMQGEYGALLNQARELDTELSRRQTTTEYSDRGGALLEMPAAGRELSVEPGARLDLGAVSSDARYFFVASGGSVNRDAASPDRYYYRAGLVKGIYGIVVYRVGRGLLPDRQTLQIRIL